MPVFPITWPISTQCCNNKEISQRMRIQGMCYASHNDYTWHSDTLPKAHMVPILGSSNFFVCYVQKKYFSKILKINLRQKLIQHLLIKQEVPKQEVLLHKKWNFPLRISSVNVTKSAGNCGFGHIYRRNP